MANPTYIRSFTAGAAIAPRRLVKMGANDGEVLQAAAVSDLIIGIVVSSEARATGDRVDVALDGSAELDMGGTVARGARITSDASGKGVNAAPAAGTNNYVIGFPLVSAVSGDIAPVVIAQSVLQG